MRPLPPPPLLVGVASDLAALRRIVRRGLRQRGVDAVEVRLDLYPKTRLVEAIRKDPNRINKLTPEEKRFLAKTVLADADRKKRDQN